MLKVVLWALLAAWTVFTTAATYLFVYGGPKNIPFPFPDQGHCTLEASSDKARKDLAVSLETLGVVRLNYSFLAGQTRQTLMTDNRTVILSKEIEGVIGRLPGNSRSFVVEDPSASALSLSADLIGRGWESVVYDMTPNTSPPGSLMVVETEALQNAVIVFRRHSMNMGQLYILP